MSDLTRCCLKSSSMANMKERGCAFPAPAAACNLVTLPFRPRDGRRCTWSAELQIAHLSLLRLSQARRGWFRS